MMIMQTVVFIYGLFTFIGGIIGFLKAKSKASLIAGGSAGILLLICAYQMNGRFILSCYVSALISLILGIRFLTSWFRNRRIMPDLIMIILSAVTFAVALWGVMK